MKRSIVWLFALCLLLPSLSRAQPRERVDLLITGGSVLTMAGPNIERGSVAIRDGAIVAVGPSAEIDERYHARETVQARGMAVLPGFVNAHTHVPMVLFRGIADDRDLMDWLGNFIWPAEALNVTPDFIKWGTRLAALEMIRSGTTTFSDMYFYEEEIARETRAAGLRALLANGILDFPTPDAANWDAGVARTRAFVNRWKGDRLIMPAVGPHAPYTVSREHLQQARALATELGVPLHIHLSETQSEVQQLVAATGLTPGAYLDSIGFLGDDVIAAHSVWLTPEEISTFAAKKVGVAHCPESNMMLASGVAPIPAMLQAGVDVGLGTDGPAGSNNNLDMVGEMASAARLQKVSRMDPKALKARQVLEMATIGGARALNLQDRIGTLEPGKRADIAIIDLGSAHLQPIYSLESAIVYAASGGDVVTTIVDGEVLMKNRRVLTLDEREILAKAEEYRKKVQASLATP